MSRNTIVFTVPGIPVGKGRPKFARRGNFVTAYTPRKTVDYETLVRGKAKEAMEGKEPFAGPVQVGILLQISPPASWSKKKKSEALDGKLKPISKPDIDNVLKAILDACNEVVFKDDKQAVAVSIQKTYAETAQASVIIEELIAME